MRTCKASKLATPLRKGPGLGMSRWRYDRTFEVEHPRMKGTVRVAFEMLQPLDDDDPLRGIFIWIRLVIWTNRSGEQVPHVNAASELEKLFRARLQAFPDPQTGGEFSLYLTDYEPGKFELRQGDALWDGEIVPPNTFLEYLGREDWRRKRRERAGP